jgi:hypothetical protein
MTSLRHPEDNRAGAVVATKRLERAMMLAAGEFSLILACCNSLAQQQQILNFFRKLSTVDIKEILLASTDETLYTTLASILGDAQPEALMVRGLESVERINQLIISTNLMRNEFRKKFHFPIVLWINDDILRKLVWLAPDFKDWASSTIRFDVPNSTLVQQVIHR